jgi:hypothetical protein
MLKELTFAALEKHDGHELHVFFEGVTEGRRSKIPTRRGKAHTNRAY